MRGEGKSADAQPKHGMSAMVCIAGGKTIAVAAGLFTLSWTHSVEKVEWRESWEATPAGLVLREARVKGSGAGMEPGEGARRVNGWWVWNPHVAPLVELVLASSGATVSGWTLCDAAACQEVGLRDREPLVLRACTGHEAGAVLHQGAGR